MSWGEVAKSRRKWKRVSRTSGRKRWLRRLRVISSQIWDSNGLCWANGPGKAVFGTAVNSGTQTGIYYSIAFYCSVMVAWAENSLGTKLVLSNTSWRSCCSLVRISQTTSSLLVSHQFMSYQIKKVIWNETWIRSMVGYITAWPSEVHYLELLVFENQ